MKVDRTNRNQTVDPVLLFHQNRRSGYSLHPKCMLNPLLFYARVETGNSIQSAGQDFRRCAGCNVALYCSKKCQSDASNAEQYPHKTLCKVIQSLIALAGANIFQHMGCDHKGLPLDVKASIVHKWWTSNGMLAPLIQIEGWSSYKRLPASDIVRAECLPGFDDCGAKIPRVE